MKSTLICVSVILFDIASYHIKYLTASVIRIPKNSQSFYVNHYDQLLKFHDQGL